MYPLSRSATMRGEDTLLSAVATLTYVPRMTSMSIVLAGNKERATPKPSARSSTFWAVHTNTRLSLAFENGLSVRPAVYASNSAIGHSHVPKHTPRHRFLSVQVVLALLLIALSVVVPLVLITKLGLASAAAVATDPAHKTRAFPPGNLHVHVNLP
jgi:hypothetical protein